MKVQLADGGCVTIGLNSRDLNYSTQSPSMPSALVDVTSPCQQYSDLQCKKIGCPVSWRCVGPGPVDGDCMTQFISVPTSASSIPVGLIWTFLWLQSFIDNTIHNFG